MNRILKILLVTICVHGRSKFQNLDLNTIRLAQRQASRASNANSSISKKEKNQDHFIIDKLVDPNKYIVGPGDQLHINIISSNETFDHLVFARLVEHNLYTAMLIPLRRNRLGTHD